MCTNMGVFAFSTIKVYNNPACKLSNQGLLHFQEPIKILKGNNSPLKPQKCLSNLPREKNPMYYMYSSELTHKAVNQCWKDVAQTQQQRPELPTLTLRLTACTLWTYFCFSLLCIFHQHTGTIFTPKTKRMMTSHKHVLNPKTSEQTSF